MSGETLYAVASRPPRQGHRVSSQMHMSKGGTQRLKLEDKQVVDGNKSA